MLFRRTPMLARTLLTGAIAMAIAPAAPAADALYWIGTWATAAQPVRAANAQTFRNQTVRLIVHVSAGGKKLRIRLSNTYGEQPLVIGAAHVGRRAAAADIDPASDRAVLFLGKPSATVPARSVLVSDPVDLDVPALSDLAVSLFLPD